MSTLASSARREAEKKAIAKPAKPDASITQLPPMLGRPRKILLVVPPGTLEESYGRLSVAAGELPMLGLAYIASSLRDQGHQVKIIDYEVNHWPMSMIAKDVEEFSPDVVGMTVYITNMKRCDMVAKIVKSVNPRIRVIFGGPQCSIFPEEAFHSEHVDIVALSEGELVIRNVMNALDDETKLSKVKGIWLRKASGEIAKNERESLIANLDLLPPPAWDLYEMEKYFPPVYLQGRRIAHLLTSRGCPFQCTFCETKLTFGRSFRYHSTDRVVKELETLIGMGFDSIQFYDDIFTANKKRVFELCDGITEKKLKFKWMCYTRTNVVPDDLLRSMKGAGCYMITYGGESGNNELLEIIKKDLTVETQADGIRRTREAGILTNASFMLGLPTETREQSLKTIQFALDTGLNYAVFGITEPYPGTELWVDAKEFGYFDDSGAHRNNLLSDSSAVWIPHGRTREELADLTHLAMRRFYLRPSQIGQAIKNFFQVPPGRAFRYVYAGLKYFLISRLQRARVGARY
jgi:anaerobic magnesium-protoporphyrin IX monomethyl ester cyclase